MILLNFKTRKKGNVKLKKITHLTLKMHMPNLKNKKKSEHGEL